MDSVDFLFNSKMILDEKRLIANKINKALELDKDKKTNRHIHLSLSEAEKLEDILYNAYVILNKEKHNEKE